MYKELEMNIDKFVENMKYKAIKGFIDISSTGKLNKRTWTFTNGHAESMVIRGGSIEKATIMHMLLQDFTPPGTSNRSDAEVLQMEVFPDNPYCPMGHFNAEWIKNEHHTYSMNLDLFPAIRIDEDLIIMKSAMDTIADRFGIDRDKMRVRGPGVFEGLDTHYTMEHFTTPLAAKVGCKFSELKDEDLELFVIAYETFFSVYLDILKKRRDTAFTQSDVRLKLERNGKWLQYLSFKDRAFKASREKGLVPPEVLIEMGWPPSALFLD
jgi:coproporphyrinogen III oxidase